MAGYLQHSVGEARMLRGSVAASHRNQISVAIVIVSAGKQQVRNVINVCQNTTVEINVETLFYTSS
jgi:uncharacterized protein YcgI (DUF1989 family)